MMPLEALLCQVAQAVQAAGGTVRQSECGQFLSWFEQGAEGALVPKTARFRLGGKESEVEAPLVALVNHNALGLSGVRLSMNVWAKDDGGRLLVEVEKPEEEAMAHRLELEFGKVAPAEGAARLLDAENQFL